MFTHVVKRDGRTVPFDRERIMAAVLKAYKEIDRTPAISLNEVVQRIERVVRVKYGPTPGVEQIQDVVESVLMVIGDHDVAKAYILYREEKAQLRAERPVPLDVRLSYENDKQYFPTTLQQAQYIDKYSRFDHEKGRRETWHETVQRSVDFLYELAGDRLESHDYEEIRHSILNMEAMPSMRLLASAGLAARRNNLAIYNCSYQAVSTLDSFVEALIISMNGCGVGYSVERQYVEQLPRVKRQIKSAPIRHVVEDSTEGWAAAVRVGVYTWFEGGDVTFDFSQVREAGAILYTKGGQASGPGPLRETLRFVRSKILARQGTVLRPIDAHDIMCSIGSCAVSGGHRRSAMIALFDFDDHEMRTCKSGSNLDGNEQRWNANNSAVWVQEPTQLEFLEHMQEMFASQRGEPGIFSRYNAIATKPERRQEHAFGTNPCVTGDTWVQTSKGPMQVIDLLDTPHETFVDGACYETTQDGFWTSGVKDIVELRTVEGYTLRLTHDHKVRKIIYKTRKKIEDAWIAAGELSPGDEIRLHNHRESQWDGDGTFGEGWLLGMLVGNGTFDTSAILPFWGETKEQMSEVALNYIHSEVGARSDCRGSHYEDKITLHSAGLRDLAHTYGIYRGNKGVSEFVEKTSSEFHRGFLRGFFDADGTVIGNQSKGVSVRLNQSNLNSLYAVQRMLLRFGIASSIYKNRYDAGYKSMPDGNGGHADYWCQANHELVISGDNLSVYADVVGFHREDKQQRLLERLNGYKRKMNAEKFYVRVESVTPCGREEVYDCSVPGPNAFDANGLYVKNCGEINLRDQGLCNLSIAVARAGDKVADLERKVRIATIIGTIQSLATHFPGMRPDWQKNAEEERLLGVDITGQMDSPLAQDAVVKEYLKNYAVEINEQYAKQFGINQSAAVTCVKPSGNSSVLLDASPGIHTRWSPYYIRRMTLGSHSPLFKVFCDAGVPMAPYPGESPETATKWQAEFPVKTPDGAKTRKDRSAIEQCEFWLQNKLYWTEHNPSVTITYTPDEIVPLIAWLWEHRNQIGGMAFLPADDFKYDGAPYEEISKEEYERRVKEFPEVDFSKIWRYEVTDQTTAAQELACSAGLCEVV